MLAAPALSCLLFVAGASGAAVPDVPTMPTSALRAGQKATVRTVFAGDSIETFDAEILGVLPGGRSEGELILARATSARVIETGVAQGMSGSPVYVDGRLIGALSSGGSFSKEPIFGITPIGEMLPVLDQPESAHPDGTAGPTGVDPVGPSPRYRELSWSDDSLALPLARGPGASRPGALALPLAAGGMNPVAIDAVRELFAASGFTVTPGGRAMPSKRAATLEPGSPVAVDVLRGDVNLSAIGTVTYRDGDRVLIFGHPFFQAGEVRLPLSTAHIVGILPSLATSFKLGVPGTPVGVATQDRRTAVGGRIGGVPDLMPFSVGVSSGARTQVFHFETIEDRGLLPQLVATAAMNSVLESGGGGAQQTVRWTMTAWRRGRSLTLGDAVAGESPLPDMIGAIVAPLRFLYGNTFERFSLDSLRISMQIEPSRRQWNLRAASAGASAVRPGGTLRVRAEVERWRGERRTLDLDVRVPAELPDGRYMLWLGGGSEFDRFAAQRLPARYRPVSVEDAWRRLAAIKPSNALYSALWAKASEVTGDGEDYPELPTSSLAVLAAPQSVGDRMRRGEWALFEQPARKLDGVLRGELLLEVNVDARTP